MTKHMNNIFGQTSAERRAFGRRNTLIAAEALLPDGSRLPCTITNVSEGGAALTTRTMWDLPDKFELLVASEDVIVECHVVHRTNGRVGVCYTRSPRRASRQTSIAAKHFVQHLLKSQR